MVVLKENNYSTQNIFCLIFYRTHCSDPKKYFFYLWYCEVFLHFYLTFFPFQSWFFRNDGFDSVSEAVGCDVIPFGCSGPPVVEHEINFVAPQEWRNKYWISLNINKTLTQMMNILMLLLQLFWFCCCCSNCCSWCYFGCCFNWILLQIWPETYPVRT